nr:cell division protein FtsH [Leptotrichiaceae bacterium]
IAKITPGFVGADLENLLNESAILAARRSSDTITMEDLDEAVDKIGMGLGQKGRIIKPEEKKLLAYHEAGHAVVSELTPGADSVHKVTIIPRGYAGGFMMPLSEEKLITTRKEMLAEIKVLFGGRVAEELVLDDISTGAHNDIKRATNITRLYVESLGMSKKIGPVNFENSNEEFNFVSNKSNETAREIDMEIMRILSEEYQNTLTILSENRWRLDNVAELLLKKETITGAEVRKIINGMSAQDIIDEDDRKIEEAKQKEEKKEQEEETLRKKEEEIAEAARLEAEEIEKKKLEEEKLMENSKSQDEDEENDDINNINDDQDNSNEEQIKEKKEIEIPNFMR